MLGLVHVRRRVTDLAESLLNPTDPPPRAAHFVRLSTPRGWGSLADCVRSNLSGVIWMRSWRPCARPSSDSQYHASPLMCKVWHWLYMPLRTSSRYACSSQTVSASFEVGQMCLTSGLPSDLTVSILERSARISTSTQPAGDRPDAPATRFWLLTRLPLYNVTYSWTLSRDTLQCLVLGEIYYRIEAVFRSFPPSYHYPPP